jgi:hypothetical protein
MEIVVFLSAQISLVVPEAVMPVEKSETHTQGDAFMVRMRYLLPGENHRKWSLWGERGVPG